jgi:hypothetical protein
VWGSTFATHSVCLFVSRYEAPNFGDDMQMGDTTVGDNGGAFADADPDFGKDTPHTSRVQHHADEQERVEDITLDQLEASSHGAAASGSSKAASSSFVALGRKRKLIVDVNTELSSADMRKGLEPTGPNDITRQPYKAERGPLAFSRPAPTRAAMQRRLRDSSMEARYSRPLTGGGRWKGKLLKIWQQGLEKSIVLPRADGSAATAGASAAAAAAAVDDEIEMGREAHEDQSFRPADVSAIAPNDDDLPPIDYDEPAYEPDQQIDAAAGIDDTTEDHHVSLGASAFGAAGDSTFATDFGDEQVRVHSRLILVRGLLSGMGAWVSG